MNAILTDLMKKTILDLDLIDTGALYNSIQVDAEFQNNILQINISSEEYIKYYIEEITEVFFNQKGFEEEFAILILPWIEQGVRDIFENRSTEPFSNIQVKLSFNS